MVNVPTGHSKLHITAIFMRSILIFVTTMCITAPVLSAPNINVGSLYEFIEPQQSTLLKRVRNDGDATAFVRITVNEIIYKGREKPVEIPLDMVALAQGKGEGLVASPARMMVPASGMQANRLLYIGKRTKERYYRVRFTPVVPSSGKEFGLSESESLQYKQEMNAGVNVMAGYGAIITIRPQQVHYNTSILDGADKFTIANNGNTTITIEGLTECRKETTQCSTPLVRHIIPGSSFQKIRKPNHHYRFTLIEGAKEKSVTL